MACFVIESKRCREFRDASKKVVAFFGVFFYFIGNCVSYKVKMLI